MWLPCRLGLLRSARFSLAVGLALALASLSLPARTALGAPSTRFFISGPGKIRIKSIRNKQRFAGRYRKKDGTYIRSALRRIGRVFGAAPPAEIAPRLIEVLAFMLSELKGGWVIISSGYRDPAYNDKLRARGKTVAKASMHLYGMAADFRLTGVKSKRAWRFARAHRVGGAGYYGDRWIHVDVGPARFWTQSTASVRKGRSNHNKAIILLPRYDIYAGGETMRLRFARVTAFPIGVKPAFTLQRAGAAAIASAADSWQDVTAVTPRLGASASGRCSLFDDPRQLAGLRWPIPRALPAGRYRLRATFCRSRWPAMPDQIVSYPFDLHRE